MKANKKLMVIVLSAVIAVGGIGIGVKTYANTNNDIQQNLTNSSVEANVATIDKNGDLVDSKGNILATKSQLKEGASIESKGSSSNSMHIVTSSDGTPLSIDKEGNLIDEDGKVVITKDELEKEKNSGVMFTGKATAGDQKASVTATYADGTPLKFDKNGNVLDKNGKIIMTKEIYEQNIKGETMPSQK